ncbi:MAG: 50S ribosomal protein L24 [Saccharofermentanales bacterium]|jgi:large subunit ribosomal protein L24
MSKVHVKVDDTVYVLTGKDAGKTGKVLAVHPKTGRVIVEGVAVSTVHKRPRRAGEPGGIIHVEAAIDASNVMVVCDKCKRPSKLGKRFNNDGQKVRYCKACGETVSTVGPAKK